MPEELVVATHNPGKLGELAALLEPLALRLRSVGEFSGEAPHESGLTFVENALLKARHAAAVSGLPALADDSGLMVEALGGAPGIHSARYAGADACDADNLVKLLDELSRVPGPRRARFVCVLVRLRAPDDPLPLICQGEWAGAVAHEPRGANGFGYDPVFIDPASGLTAAQMAPAAKAAVSHRGCAARALVGQLAPLRRAG